MNARGWCHKHYDRWQKYGDPLKTTLIYFNDEARFWSKVDRSGSGCWYGPPWVSGM